MNCGAIFVYDRYNWEGSGIPPEAADGGTISSLCLDTCVVASVVGAGGNWVDSTTRRVAVDSSPPGLLRSWELTATGLPEKFVEGSLVKDIVPAEGAMTSSTWWKVLDEEEFSVWLEILSPEARSAASSISIADFSSICFWRFVFCFLRKSVLMS